MSKSARWIAEYYRTIGGSMVGTIMGVSPNQTPGQLAAIMQGRAAPPDLSQNDDVVRGSTFEPTGRKLLAKHLKRSVRAHPQTKFIYNPDYQWAHCLVDGWVGDVPVEQKWPRLSTFRRAVMFGPPDTWIGQCHHNMAVTGARKIVLAVFCADALTTPMILTIDRDDDLVGRIMAWEEEFFRRVQAGDRFEDEPAAEPIDIPEFAGTADILETDEAKEAARRLREADNLRTEVQGYYDAAKQRLESMAPGRVTEIRDGDVQLARCYHQDGKTLKRFDDVACVQQYPETAKFLTTKRSKPEFRVYFLGRRSERHGE